MQNWFWGFFDNLTVYNQALFVLLCVLLIWNAYIVAFNKGVPNIRTAPSTQIKIVEALKKHFAGRGGENARVTIIDLGSGNGEFTRRIARTFPQARIIGIETALKSFLWSRFMQRRLGLKNLEYVRQDFFKYDLSRADAVVFYQSYAMELLGRKLHADLKEGTIVISNRFRLGDGWVPAETVEAKTIFPFEKEFFVYYMPQRPAEKVKAVV